jgi:two-component system nitrate/nitrite response regulator NarL
VEKSESTASFAQALELLQTVAVQPDLIIGYPAPDFEEEYQAITTLRHEFPNIKIIVLTQTPTALDIEHAVRHGVSGLLSKDLSAEALKQALELILMGGTVGSIAVICAPQSASDLPEPIQLNGWKIDSASTRPGSEAPDLGDDRREKEADKPGCRKPIRLSGREEQILDCLARGMSNKLIARDLNISEATVKVHLRSLLRKLRLQNRTQAAIWAVQSATAPTGLAVVPALRPVSERAVPRLEVGAQNALAPIEA